MKIQIITKTKIETSLDVKINTFDSPESLDLYDVNIFDLRNELWYNKLDNISIVDLSNDIKHIKDMIQTSLNKNIIIVLPQNSDFNYNYTSRYINGKDVYDYRKKEKLKNCFLTIIKIIKENFIDFPYSLGYELNRTTLSKQNYNSDFYIIDVGLEVNEIITKSDRSNKITSLKTRKGIIITTLEIFNGELLEHYLNFIGYMNDKITIPEWLYEINFLDDLKLKKDMKSKETELVNINEKIEAINLSLAKNNEYKSILYETGTNLSDKVNKILSEIFNIELEKFNDIYEEDFLIKLLDITFVVEIKGVVHSVNGKNVSDAFNHVQVYLDDIEQKNIQENVKGILIVANQREINPKNREAINERQVNIAKRNDILIVKTEDLLILYEKFIDKQITSNEIKLIFRDNVGLLDINK